MTTNTSSANGTILSTGISKIDEIYVYGKILSGINEINSSADINISPNPAKDNINISTSENIISISIFDVIGNKITEVSPNSDKTSVNIKNLNKGLYFIQVYVQNYNKPFVQKFIVN
jgi:hypothetical protein